MSLRRAAFSQTISLLLIVCISTAYGSEDGVTASTNAEGVTAATGTSVGNLSEAQSLVVSPFSLFLETEYSGNLYRENDPSREGSLGITLSPTYVVSDKLTFFALANVSQEQVNARNTTLSNTQVGASFLGFQLSEKTATLHSLTGVLPTNAELRKTDSYQGGMRLGNGIGAEAFGISAKYTFYVLRNFHEFNLTAEARANIQYSLQHRLEVAIPVVRRWSVDLSGSHRTGYTYRGANRFNYTFDSTLNYTAAPKWIVFVGTSTDAPALKANGTESNMKIFDEDRSYVRTGMNYVF